MLFMVLKIKPNYKSVHIFSKKVSKLFHNFLFHSATWILSNCMSYDTYSIQFALFHDFTHA